MTGDQICLVIIAWHCDGNCHWHCDITVGIYIRSLVSLVFPGLMCRIVQVRLVCSVVICMRQCNGTLFWSNIN